MAAAVAVPVAGRLADLYGEKKLLSLALVAFVAGSLVCAVSSNLGVLIAGRAVTGLSMAAIPLGISLVSAALPPERSRSGIALISAMLGIGGALGLPVRRRDRRASASRAARPAWPGRRTSCRKTPLLARGELDVGGSVLLGTALVVLLLPLSEAGVWGWGGRRTIGLLAAAVLFTVFVAVERRLASPVVNVRVNARPALLLTNIASLAVGFALFATLLGTTSYVQAPPAYGYGFGSSILVSSMCLLPSGVFMLSSRCFRRRSPPAPARRSPSPWARSSSASASWSASRHPPTCGRCSSGPRWPA